MLKTLKISEEAHSRLQKLGNKGETFTDIIIKLTDENDEKQKE